MCFKNLKKSLCTNKNIKLSKFCQNANINKLLNNKISTLNLYVFTLDIYYINSLLINIF